MIMGSGVVPGVLHMLAYQGDSFSRTVTLQQEDETPVDLTGMEVEFSLAVARNARPAFTYAGVITDPTSGEFSVYVPEDETKKWGAGRYQYELTVRDGLGYAQTFLTGRVLVEREVVL